MPSVMSRAGSREQGAGANLSSSKHYNVASRVHGAAQLAAQLAAQSLNPSAGNSPSPSPSPSRSLYQCCNFRFPLDCSLGRASPLSHSQDLARSPFPVQHSSSPELELSETGHQHLAMYSNAIDTLPPHPDLAVTARNATWSAHSHARSWNQSELLGWIGRHAEMYVYSTVKSTAQHA